MEKREILQVLPEATLSQLAAAYAVNVDKRPSKGGMMEALAYAKRISARELLETMTVVSLMSIAQEFSLPKGPRLKTKLIDSILRAKVPQPSELLAVTTASELAAVLGETEPEPIKHVERIVGVIGIERARKFAARAIFADSTSGMWYGRRGQHRRTLGGCFFRLIRDGLGKEERRRAISSPKPSPPSQQQQQDQQQTMNRQQRHEFLSEAAREDTHPAEVVSVKITIIGRPNRVLQPPNNNAVIALLERREPPKSLPKGLPQPTGKTQYAIFISLKQWRKVEPKLKDPADTLIIEGFPLVDEAFNGISVMATSATTRKLKQEQAAALQAKKRAAAEAASG